MHFWPHSISTPNICFENLKNSMQDISEKRNSTKHAKKVSSKLKLILLSVIINYKSNFLGTDFSFDWT